jgi:hypothetical protein
MYNERIGYSSKKTFWKPRQLFECNIWFCTPVRTVSTWHFITAITELPLVSAPYVAKFRYILLPQRPVIMQMSVRDSFYTQTINTAQSIVCFYFASVTRLFAAVCWRQLSHKEILKGILCTVVKQSTIGFLKLHLAVWNNRLNSKCARLSSWIKQMFKVCILLGAYEFRDGVYCDVISLQTDFWLLQK